MYLAPVLWLTVAARAIWLTSPHRGARRRPRHRRPATDRLGCAEDQVPHSTIWIVCVAHLGDRTPADHARRSSQPRRHAAGRGRTSGEHARRPPGREAKYTTRPALFLLGAFVGRCGVIARRENGAGFVKFWSACADNVRRAPPGAACASIFVFNKHFFTKIIQLQTTSRGRYRPAVHPQRRRRRRRRRSPAAGRRPPTTDRRPPTADRPVAGRPSAPPSRRHRPGCRGGADGRRETIERRALDAADDLVAVRASVLRVGKNKRF